MSLPILIAMVVVGMAAIVLAIHLTGGSRVAGLADEAQARARFAEDFPGKQVRGVTLSTDGRAAFLELEGGGVGLVQSLGDRFLTRLTSPCDVASVRRAGDGALLLRLTDFTFGGGTYRFADERVAGRLESLLLGRPPEERTV